jgi:Na+-driven multidrug efflux pump
MSIAATVIIMLPIMIFAPHVVRFFNAEPEVIRYGTMMMRWITAFHVFGCFNQILAGALRGAGNSRAPMIIMLSSFVLFRQLYMYVVANFIANEALLIVMGYPAGWMVCSAAMILYYKRTQLTKTRLVDDASEVKS